MKRPKIFFEKGKKFYGRLFTLSFLFTFSSCTSEFDNYRGWTGIQGEKTGFFHLEKIDGRQWFINPEGNVLFPVALSHPFTGESAYVCREQFDGNYQNYVEDSFEKLLNLGFNCSLSGHTSPERNRNAFVQADPILNLFEKHNFPYLVGIYLLKHPPEFASAESYSGIFSGSYMKIWAHSIKKTCMKYKDNSLVLGYYYGYGGLNNEELYDYRDSYNKSPNVISDYPEQAAKMKVAYDAWWSSMRPYMIQENESLNKEKPFHTAYESQKASEGIPDHHSSDL